MEIDLGTVKPSTRGGGSWVRARCAWDLDVGTWDLDVGVRFCCTNLIFVKKLKVRVSYDQVWPEMFIP
jgi:hypothetical protein